MCCFIFYIKNINRIIQNVKHKKKTFVVVVVVKTSGIVEKAIMFSLKKRYGVGMYDYTYIKINQ